ncbi:SGNH/GDSL hydrolase family protein [Nocardioides dongkuii]|uniref:SGNH/GDSL hydrolase family protein n=1 Tax=Nocardioides dongkuii TaxID=2760089 RepID=UPI002467BEDE|nr:SGNH/GDSL hydrolase family protein [Nocardioides dongkuii]
MGDSIGWGQGASRPEDRLAARLVAGLADHGIESDAEVVAVPGARSTALAGQVRRAQPARPDVAVIVIGANDLTHRTPPRDAAADLGAAVRALRSAGARVVVAPAPDLSSVPHVPAAMRPAVRRASEELRALQVAAVEAEGGLVADADHRTSRAFAEDPTLFSADRFHPSSRGYAVIAASLLPAVLEALRTDSA